MHIFLLTSVYPSRDAAKGTTPVVHYFAKEWVSAGHTVHVFHISSCFPKAYYVLARPFKQLLDSHFGHVIPNRPPEEYDEIKDNVRITHISLKKVKPHGRFPQQQIQRAFSIISSFIEKEYLPDCFIGHWDNPQLELLKLLKERFGRPTCLVYHSNGFSQLSDCYGKETDDLVNSVDLVGFRNIAAQSSYEKLFNRPSHSFIAASGVSRPFIEAGEALDKEISSINRFVFVGSLIYRKYPVSVLEALHLSFDQQPFELVYIGDGDEKRTIQKRFADLKCSGTLSFTGRIPRDEVIRYLSLSDVFVMISKGEVFGLVYLEAMAMGCITIASRHEGIDGIIEDGVNGFLCESGNVEELSSIISRIRNLPLSQVQSISQNAKKTARAYSDVMVAQNYIDELSKIV